MFILISLSFLRDYNCEICCIHLAFCKELSGNVLAGPETGWRYGKVVWSFYAHCAELICVNDKQMQV
jgi:hypothetical protein